MFNILSFEILTGICVEFTSLEKDQPEKPKRLILPFNFVFGLSLNMVVCVLFTWTSYSECLIPLQHNDFDGFI